MHGAHGKPLHIAGKTQHLDLQWGEVRGRACFIIIVGLESPPCLIGMDIMRPLRVHIDVTNGTATPTQPDPQTVHLNAAQSQQQRIKMQLPEVDLPAVGAACPPQSQQQRKKMPLPEVGLPAVRASCPLQTQQQRKKMPLPEVGLPAVGATCPPQTQLQQMKMPLPEVGSPAVGTASPSQFPQQRMEIPLPEVGPPAMGAAYSSHPQQQRREMPLPVVATLALLLQKPLPWPLQPPLCPASHSPPPHCRFPHRLLLPPTPLAALCCYKWQTFPQRRLASFVATTRGPPRTFYSVPTTLCWLL